MSEHQFYAQFGEDEILYEIFKRNNNGVCVEVGGYDGMTGSNSYFFEKLGWKCLIVEPMPDFCNKIRKLRNCDVVEMAASNTKGWVEFYVAEGVETLSTIEKDPKHFERISQDGGTGIKKIQVETDLLTNILLERGFNKIDFLTLDVEGHELSALEGLSFEHVQIRLLIIEDASFGEDNSVRDYLKRRGFVRFRRTGCNDWYVNKDDELAGLINVLETGFSIYFGLLWRRFKSVVKYIIRY